MYKYIYYKSCILHKEKCPDHESYVPREQGEGVMTAGMGELNSGLSIPFLLTLYSCTQ